MHDDLGRDCFDDPLHTSCTGIGYHSDIVPLDTIMTVVARQFALMGEAGYENFISSCITSFGIYTEILATWEEFPEKEEQTRDYLYKATGREFRKPKKPGPHFGHRFPLARGDRPQGEIPAGQCCHRRAAAGGRTYRLPLRQDLSQGGYRRFGVSLCARRYDRCVGRPVRRLSGAAALLRLRFRNYLVMANRGYSVANSHKKKFESMAPYKPDFIVANCRAAPCSSTNGNIRSPRWRASPTVRTDEAFRY